MFFRSLSLMRFSEVVSESLSRMDEAFVPHRLRKCGPIEIATRGFLPPVGDGSDASLTHSVNGFTLFAVGNEEKVMPGPVVRDELTQRIQKITREEGRRVGGAERKRLKEQIVADFLPRAFIKQSRVNAYTDPKSGWIVIDTSSRKAAESVVTQVREALGSFPAVPLAPEEGPSAIMTQWLHSGTLPAGLSFGDECELREPGAQGAVSRSRRQDLSSDDIAEHLKQGKHVFQLGLVFEDRLSFVLGEDLSIRKLKFLDVIVDQLRKDTTDAAREADATFALMTLELSQLLAKLEEWFVARRPSDS